jgi:inward rectifier potassium channel
MQGSRLTNRDGSVNLRKDGLPLFRRISIYHTLIRMSRTRFLGVVFLFYTSLNLFFAVVYYTIGIQHLSGTEAAVTWWEQFGEAFFFSSQSLTTVGYGRVAPIGLVTNMVASLESLLGIVSFALVTGLFYGRFARPRAYILFSDNLLISPYKGGRAMMFRLVTYKNNHLTEVETQLTLAALNADGAVTFYPLKTEIARVNSLALSWTIVHPIDEESPLWGCTEAEMAGRRLEVLVFVKGFDDHFSANVQQRTSYHWDEMVYGAKFIPMFRRSTDGSATVLQLDKINAFQEVPMPDAMSEKPAEAVDSMA